MNLHQKIAARRAEVQRERKAEEERIDKENSDTGQTIEILITRGSMELIFEIDRLLSMPKDNFDLQESASFDKEHSSAITSEENKILSEKQKRVKKGIHKKIESYLRGKAADRWKIKDCWVIIPWTGVYSLSSSFFGEDTLGKPGPSSLVVCMCLLHLYFIHNRHVKEIKSELIKLGLDKKYIPYLYKQP